MDFKLDGYYSSEMDIKKGKNYDVNDEYCKWYDVYLNIRNKYFNYNKTQESLLEFELREIYSVFNKCLNNELDHDEELNFIEPDLELLVYKSTDDNHSHLCDFRICMYLEDAGATGDYYSILISDEEMNMIKNKIQSL